MANWEKNKQHGGRKNKAHFLFAILQRVFRYISICFLFLITSLQAGTYYPFQREEKFGAGKTWGGFRVVQDFSGYWTDDQGKEWRVPFWETGQKELALNWAFRVKPDSVPLVLALEGIAANSGIYLNGRLLHIHRKPFEGVLIPLNASWLSSVGNILRIEMDSESTIMPLGIPPAIGIHRQVWLLTPSDSSVFIEEMPRIAYSDSAIIYLPFSAQNYFNVSRDRIQKDLSDMEYAGVKVVYFPVEPSFRVLSEFEKAGYTRIYSLSGVKKVAWFNAFPIAAGQFFREDVFWKNSSGKPTSNFGKWQAPEVAMACNRNRDNLYALLLFLIPLLGLVVFRLVHPHAFFNQIRWLYSRRLEMEMVSNRKFLRPWENSLLTLTRIIFSSSALALFIYYLKLHCVQPGNSLLLQSDSLFCDIYLSDWSPLWIWLFFFSIELLWLLGRLVFMGFIGGIFRIQGFQRVYLDLSILSSFPLMTILPPLALYLLYSPLSQQPVVEIIFWVIGSLYILRYWLLLSLGAYQHFRFPPILIFLYICTFEILPWLLIF